MDYALDWRLIHRSPEDTDRLFRASAFGRRTAAIDFEEEGVNLFATCEHDLGPSSSTRSRCRTSAARS